MYSLCRYGRKLPYKLNAQRFLSSSQVVLANAVGKNNAAVPEYADAVVIGGGSIGCSTAYHLAKHGLTNIVLIERDQLSAGTTWHSAGLVWRTQPSDLSIELLNYTRHLANFVLEGETGLSAGYNENGGLFIANNKERLQEYQRLQTLGKVYGVDSYILSPKESKDLYPLMNIDDLYGTMYSPGDGTIDPSSWTAALARGATMKGAKVVENCEVTGVDTTVDDFGVSKVTAVDTTLGKIKTPCVVNACGVWAPYIGAMCGVTVPLIAMKHAYIITEKIEGIRGMPNIRDHDASVYLKMLGDELHIGGYENNPIFWDEVKKDFAFSLFDLDWDVFSAHIEGAINRVPVVETTPVKSTVCGPESFTADHKALVGPDIDLRGFYHACGFNSGGIMYAGGCGNELAKWIIHGHPDLDMFAYDVSRFHKSMTGNKKWNDERSHEAYAKNYSMVFPHDEPLASRNMRKDPFHDLLEAQGCHFQERHGWERPGWFSTDKDSKTLEYDWYGATDKPKHENYTYQDLLYGDYTFGFSKHFHIIGDEVFGCRDKVAAFNMSYFAKFMLTGPDAAAAVDWIFTANMRKPAGSTTYTCMLNDKGGINADLTVSVIDSDDGSSPMFPTFEGQGYYLAIGGAIGQYSWGHIQNAIHSKRFDVNLIDFSESAGLLSIQGPNSRTLLEELTGEDLSNEAFPFSTHKTVTVGGQKLRAIRLTFVGELGWELHIPAEGCVDVYNAVFEVGKKHGIVNAGYRAIDDMSIEKGYRHWHADIRDTDTPLEGGLGFTCKLKTDVPFQGRDVLEKQKKEGLPKKLACFTIDEHRALLGGEAIYRDDEIVGFIRRGGYGYTVGKSIGFGYVQRPDGEMVNNAYLKSGEYKIERMGTKIPATFHLKTPFDPKNQRIKGVYQ